MSRLSVFAVAGFVFLLSLSMVGAEPPKNGIKWETDLLKAREKAVESGRPLLVVFGADWCTFCKKMERTTLAEKSMVKEINSQFIPVHLDFDKQRPVANALKIKAIPHTVVLSIDADVLSQHKGFATADVYRKSLAKGLKAHQIQQASAKSGTVR